MQAQLEDPSVLLDCCAAQLTALSVLLLGNPEADKPSDDVIGSALYGIAMVLQNINRH